MGDCMSCNLLCCPSDKTHILSEFSSPKNASFRPDLSPLIIMHRKFSDQKQSASDSFIDSPGIKPRGSYRVSNRITRRRSFLALARERSRKSSEFHCETELFDDYEASKQRSLTYNDEDLEVNKGCQLRISLDSHNQHAGDTEMIEYY